MELTLREIRSEAGDCSSFLFEPQTPLKWQAGQYLKYTVPHPDTDERGDSRYFSISSAPHEGLDYAVRKPTCGLVAATCMFAPHASACAYVASACHRQADPPRGRGLSSACVVGKNLAWSKLGQYCCLNNGADPAWGLHEGRADAPGTKRQGRSTGTLNAQALILKLWLAEDERSPGGVPQAPKVRRRRR